MSKRKFGSFKTKVPDDELEQVTFEQLLNPFNFYNLLMSNILFTWLRNHGLLVQM